MELQGDDRAQYERLLEKYGTGAISRQPLGQPPPLSNGASKGSDIDMRLCPECEASGRVVENYNFRRLEATCRKCEGRGAFFYRDGELIKEDKPRTGEESEQERLRFQAFRTSTSRAKERAAVAGKLQQYEQELKALEASMCPNSKDREELVLQEQLQQQLASEISSLTRRLATLQ